MTSKFRNVKTPQVKPWIFHSGSTAQSNCFVMLRRDHPTSAGRMWPVVAVLTQTKISVWLDSVGPLALLCKIALSQPDVLSFLSA